jgi:hypothetical protein
MVGIEMLSRVTYEEVWNVGNVLLWAVWFDKCSFITKKDEAARSEVPCVFSCNIEGLALVSGLDRSIRLCIQQFIPGISRIIPAPVWERFVTG